MVRKLISIQAVSYRYPGMADWAIRDLTMQTQQGELLLIAGSTGSGKSSLLRTANGLIPHFHGGVYHGKVLVDGLDTISYRPRDLADRVGFVGQDPESHAVAETVEDDIAFTLENLGFDLGTMRKRIEEVMDALSIAHLRQRPIDSLSGGERQRSAIAAALAAMPQHLVLDEPTSQLDPQSAEDVIASILRLRDDLGLTVIMSEHRLERVLQYADRLGVIDEKVRVGDPAEILSHGIPGPPIVQLGKKLGWTPLPLSLRQARVRADSLDLTHRPRESPPAPGELRIRAKKLTVSLGGRRVLKGLDLEVFEGETVAIMGRNGAGKTTLLRILAGLIHPTAGHVDRSLPTALVPQNPELLLFRRTVSDEIASTLKGRKKEVSPKNIALEAEKFGVLDLVDRYPRDLSGGEKTKVALAAACAGDPAIVLLDEPTRGMDEAAKTHLAAQFTKWRQEGRSIVIATHDVELAARTATRVIILAEGEVVVDASPVKALASSLTFATQMNKVFGDPSILTIEDVMARIKEE